MSISSFFSFLKPVISVFNYIGSCINTLLFGFVSLINGLWEIIDKVLFDGFFDLLTDGFKDLSFFIGKPGALIVLSLLLLIFVRIGIAFVFRLFRLNADYKTLVDKKK